MNQDDKTRFDALLEWSQQHGAELHPSLEIYNDHVSKYSLRVKPSSSHGDDGVTLTPGFTAVTCPVSTTLSYLNALVAGPIDISSESSPQSQTLAFPPRFMQAAPPHVVGRFFLVQEYLKGEDSYWWPYLATLPSPDQPGAWALPAFWPDDDIAFLQGTNAHVAIDEIQANVQREFKHAQTLLKEDNFPDFADYTSQLYNWAFCIFTSRSFRPSLMLSDAAKQQVSNLLPDGCQLDDFSILQPLFDIGNHSMTARYAWDTTSNPATCQLICRDAYQPGDQVYNNYGLKTNSELLLGYGFILPETPALHNDYVHVRKRQQPPSPDTTTTTTTTAASDSDPQKPKDFLISLRPISHPSSLVGRSRVSLGPSSRLSSVPYFMHFEPALVDDLASALAGATPGLVEALERWNLSNEDPTNSALPEGEEVLQLVEKVRGMLGGKLQFDYQRLGLGDEDEDEDGAEAGPPPGNRNQELAAEYRAQCGKVLIAALEGLVGDDS
jgi:hypothetical protein